MILLNKRVLILSGIPWNTTIQRHHNIAFLLERLNYDVFFVEKIPSSKFTIKKLVHRIISDHKKNEHSPCINKNNIRIISSQFLNPMKGVFWIVNKYQIKQLIKQVGKNFDVIINYLPVNTTYCVMESINAKITIYDCVRDFENWGGYPCNIQKIESKVISRSDFILVDSYYLNNKIKSRYPASSVIQILPTVSKQLIPILRNCKVSNKIRNILYFGAVGSHIDVDILNKLAEDGYNIHIIGEVYHSVKLSDRIINHGFISNLVELSEMIVEYANAIIIPYKGNMDGVIPAKLMQCIATGLPVYINRFYDSEILKQYLYIYEEYNDLKNMIEQYNLDKHIRIREEMIDFCSQNSEDNQFLKLCSILK